MHLPHISKPIRDANVEGIKRFHELAHTMVRSDHRITTKSAKRNVIGGSNFCGTNNFVKDMESPGSTSQSNSLVSVSSQLQKKMRAVFKGKREHYN